MRWAQVVVSQRERGSESEDPPCDGLDLQTKLLQLNCISRCLTTCRRLGQRSSAWVRSQSMCGCQCGPDMLTPGGVGLSRMGRLRQSRLFVPILRA
jgi:hypothetical protein